jgi:FSR family fosmidomycin resistance protein-like MFS transporter
VSAPSAPTLPVAPEAPRTALPILFAISGGHLINDTIQSLLPAVYPLLKDELNLSFGQIGLITLAFQLTASVLQPFVGIHTDRHPKPFSLPTGMLFTLGGVSLLAFAHTFGLVLVAALLIGLGSSIFHPEASRVARFASGGKHGFAQSLFQVGGNAGSSIGPLLAALFVVRGGQSRIVWFAVLPLLGFMLLMRVGAWYRDHLVARRAATVHRAARPLVSRQRTIGAIAILVVLIFSKYFYLACLTNYYTFYLIETFHVSVRNAQLLLFLFLAGVAAGTLIGGPIGDRVGRKTVIWASILGVAPFALAMPHANLFWCTVLSTISGFVLASAFSAIVVYAQELIPNRPGMVAGIFFGFAFGMGGIGSAVLGAVADHTSVTFVFRVCSYLPLLGFLTAFLPEIEARRKS